MRKWWAIFAVLVLCGSAFAASPGLDTSRLKSPFGSLRPVSPLLAQFTQCPVAKACVWAANNTGAWRNLHVNSSGNLLIAAAGSPTNPSVGCPTNGACPYAVKPDGSFVNLSVDSSNNLLVNCTGCGGGSVTTFTVDCTGIVGLTCSVANPTSTPALTLSSTLFVRNNAANTFTAAGTLDLSGSTVANALRAPAPAGATATANGALAYDSTSNNLHTGNSGADAILPITTASPTNGNCVQWVVTAGQIKQGDTGGVCGGTPGGGIVGYSASSVTLTANTYYFPIVGAGLPSTTETNVDTEAPSAATIANFYASFSVALGGGNSAVFTYRNNATSQAMTCTISGASTTTCNDSTHSFTVAKGDLLTIQVVTTGTIVVTPTLVMTAQFGTTGSNGTVNTGTTPRLAWYGANGTAVSDSGANLLWSSPTLTIGLAGTTTGIVKIASATASGAYNITAPANAATPTLTLPTTSNVLAGQFAGDGVVFNSSLNTASAAGTLTPTLITVARGAVLSGPAAFGASAAAPTYRAVNVNDMPGGYGQCTFTDYVICGSSVDANGYPNFVAAGTGGAVTVTGTSLNLFIQGVNQTGTGTYTNVVTGTTSSFNYLYVKQDTANANLVAADFAVTILAPVWSYKAPTACTSATSSNPQYWYDLSSKQWKSSTAAACSFSVASPQVLFLAVFWVTSTPTVSGVAHYPYDYSPTRVLANFGDGFDAESGQGGTDITKQEKTSGTTTLDNFHTYTSFELTGATVVPTVFASNGTTQGTLIVYSQNPVLLVNTSSVNANGLGRAGGAAATTTCSAGGAGGFAGTGGGGGGASATNAGCVGGGRVNFGPLSTGNGGGLAGGVAGNGSNGTSTPTNPPRFANFIGLIGSSGASGGGDGGAASGGAGGGGGGAIVIVAPSVVEDASSTISANAGAAGAGGGTNGGGGGGGGGGSVITQAGFATLSGTDTANSTNGGTKAGGGGNGGNGTAGIVQNWKLW